MTHFPCFAQGNLRGEAPGLDLEPEDFSWLTEQVRTAARRLVLLAV